MSEVVRLQQLVGRVDRGEIDSAAFLDAFTRFLAEHIGCTRAGVWLFIDSDQGPASRCLAMYDRQHDALVEATDMLTSEVTPYFEALLRDGCVVADDARSHPATQCFTAEYLDRLDVRSLMDVGFSVNGQMLGSFSCEEVGRQRVWTAQQLQSLRRIGARASLSLVRAASSHADTAPGMLWDTSTSQRLSKATKTRPNL